MGTDKQKKKKSSEKETTNANVNPMRTVKSVDMHTVSQFAKYEDKKKSNT